MKGKKSYREIPAVTSLSPEECVQQLQKLGEYGVRIETKHEHEDIYLVKAERWKDNRMTAAVECLLVRWEGTSTRIKLTRKPVTTQHDRINRLRWQFPLVALFIGLILVIITGADARSAAILLAVAFLIGLIPGPLRKYFWMTQESDDLLWIMMSVLNGKSLEPEARVRSIEEMGLDEELKRYSSS